MPHLVILRKAKDLDHFALIRVPGGRRQITGSSLGAAAGSDAEVFDSPVGCQSRGVTEPAGESCQKPERLLTEGVCAQKRLPSSAFRETADAASLGEGGWVMRRKKDVQ